MFATSVQIKMAKEYEPRTLYNNIYIVIKVSSSFLITNFSLTIATRILSFSIITVGSKLSLPICWISYKKKKSQRKKGIWMIAQKAEAIHFHTSSIM